MSSRSSAFPASEGGGAPGIQSWFLLWTDPLLERPSKLFEFSKTAEKFLKVCCLTETQARFCASTLSSFITYFKLKILDLSFQADFDAFNSNLHVPTCYLWALSLDFLSCIETQRHFAWPLRLGWWTRCSNSSQRTWDGSEKWRHPVFCSAWRLPSAVRQPNLPSTAGWRSLSSLMRSD